MYHPPMQCTSRPGVHIRRPLMPLRTSVGLQMLLRSPRYLRMVTQFIPIGSCRRFLTRRHMAVPTVYQDRLILLRMLIHRHILPIDP